MLIDNDKRLYDRLAPPSLIRRHITGVRKLYQRERQRWSGTSVQLGYMLPTGPDVTVLRSIRFPTAGSW